MWLAKWNGIDTPSRTGRKHFHLTNYPQVSRYTLPYREETVQSILHIGDITIHPPIQGGNNPQNAVPYSPPDTPSHTGRKPIKSSAKRC